VTLPLPEPPWERTLFGVTSYYNPYTGKYTTSRAYALRMQRGYQAGLPRQKARGQRPGEAARRRERETRETGITPRERGLLYRARFEQENGFSYAYWQRLHRLFLTDLNKRVGKAGRIRPWMVGDVRREWERGWRDFRRPELLTWQAWVEVHLGERLWATILYQDENENAYGAFNFAMRSAVPDVAFWYYH